MYSISKLNSRNLFFLEKLYSPPQKKILIFIKIFILIFFLFKQLDFSNTFGYDTVLPVIDSRRN